MKSHCPRCNLKCVYEIVIFLCFIFVELQDKLNIGRAPEHLRDMWISEGLI